MLGLKKNNEKAEKPIETHGMHVFIPSKYWHVNDAVFHLDFTNHLKQDSTAINWSVLTWTSCYNMENYSWVCHIHWLAAAGFSVGL